MAKTGSAEADRQEARAAAEGVSGTLRQQASAVFEGERDFIANMANLSSLVYHSLPDLNWCGFYLDRQGELVLGPFQGQVACVRIPYGKGVCGTAALERRTLVVPDVNEFPGHIACDPASRSEIVVPLLAGDRVVGVFDIDSPVPDRFAEEDRSALEELASLLLRSSDLPAPPPAPDLPPNSPTAG